MKESDFNKDNFDEKESDKSKNSKNKSIQEDLKRFYDYLKENEEFIENSNVETYIEAYHMYVRAFNALNNFYRNKQIEKIQEYLTFVKEIDEIFAKIADKINAPLPDKKLFDTALLYLSELNPGEKN